MAKNEAKTDAKCPQCGDENEKIWRLDIKAASNVTLLVCDCEHEFAKDQSVKLPGNLVSLAAEAMYMRDGYSSLGEFVRDSVRRHSEFIMERISNHNATNIVTAMIENPEKIAEIRDALQSLDEVKE